MLAQTERLLTQLKALADPYRLRLTALISRGECSVGELGSALGLSQPRVSQHLRVLCNAGILQRFRDGQYAYYRLSDDRDGAPLRRQLLALLPCEDPDFERDLARLRGDRGKSARVGLVASSPAERSLHRELVALTVTAPLGDLLDVGSGRGKLLKLLGSRAKTAVGVDIDADARRIARAEALFAGLSNVSLRQGDRSSLPFADSRFDTIILDDVLADTDPRPVLAEAARVLRAGGRLVLLLAIPAGSEPAASIALLANSCRELGLRLGSPKPVPASYPEWLLAIATPVAGREVDKEDAA